MNFDTKVHRIKGGEGMPPWIMWVTWAYIFILSIIDGYRQRGMGKEIEALKKEVEKLKAAHTKVRVKK